LPFTVAAFHIDDDGKQIPGLRIITVDHVITRQAIDRYGQPF